MVGIQLEEQNTDWQVFTQLAKAEFEKLKSSWQELSKGVTLHYGQTFTPEEFFRLVKAHAVKTGQALQFACAHSPDYAAQVRTFSTNTQHPDEVYSLRLENDQVRRNFFYLQKHAVARHLYEQTCKDLRASRFLADIACVGTFYYSDRCADLEAENKVLMEKLLELQPGIDLTTLISENREYTPHRSRLPSLDQYRLDETGAVRPSIPIPKPLPVMPTTTVTSALFQPAPATPRVWPNIALRANFESYYSGDILQWKRLVSQNKPLNEVCIAMFQSSNSKDTLNARIVINQITINGTADALDLCLLLDKVFRENTFIQEDITVKSQLDFCRQMLFKQFGPSSTISPLSSVSSASSKESLTL